MSRLSMGLVGFQAADALTLMLFYVLVGPLAGHGSEQNPLVLGIMGTLGVAGFALFKIGVSAGAALVYDRKPRSIAYRLLMMAAAASGALGFAFNTTALVRGLGG